MLDPAPFYAPKPVKFRMARLPDGECSASECGLICNDYWNQGWGRIISTSHVCHPDGPSWAANSARRGQDFSDTGCILIVIVVPRVKLAYDKKVYDIIHPERRNLTAIRGYKRLGGLPDDPHTDPQDRSWYGPHDRLFVEAETVEMDFHTGPEYGMSLVLDRRFCEEIRSDKG